MTKSLTIVVEDQKVLDRVTTLLNAAFPNEELVFEDTDGKACTKANELVQAVTKAREELDAALEVYGADGVVPQTSKVVNDISRAEFLRIAALLGWEIKHSADGQSPVRLRPSRPELLAQVQTESGWLRFNATGRNCLHKTTVALLRDDVAAYHTESAQK